MRHIILNTPIHESNDHEKLERLTRHLKARLEDFGPEGPEVTQFDMLHGIVGARFPNNEPWEIVNDLERDHGILSVAEENDVVFYLNDDIQFEELDYLWGSLFE